MFHIIILVLSKEWVYTIKKGTYDKDYFFPLAKRWSG